MMRSACGLAAFGSFVVISARASRIAARDVAARPMLAPLPIEPRELLGGNVVRLRRDALMIALPLLAFLATPWSVTSHIEAAWRVGALLLAVVLGADAAASVSFLTVGAGSRKGPGGSFVVESILVLVPLVGVATASYAWAAIVPLAALALVARQARNSALGCVRWLDDADDFERETPIWRALLVLGAFQSAQVLSGRLVGLSALDEATRIAIAYAVSSVVLVALTAHARRDAPRMRAFPEKRSAMWLGLGAIAGLVSGALAILYLMGIRKLGVELPETSGPSRITMGVVAIGLAPLAEEIFFRGWLLSCIEESITVVRRRRWLTPIVSAFAFAAVHPPISFVPVFILGLVASILFARTRALGPGIAAHACHNAIAFFLAS
jgi:membrane protease YdiL (CAAX protease family)